MIVVFVVDTSPSMSRPVFVSSAADPRASRSLTRLDLAKMAVEDLSRRLRKGLALSLNYPMDAALAKSLSNLGQGGTFVPHQDALLLLSTSPQFPDTPNCAAGGRLLIGFGTNDTPVEDVKEQRQEQVAQHIMDPLHNHHVETFQRRLKNLQAAKWDPSDGTAFPDDAGGAAGLNIAISTGLQLLSRYRLHSHHVDNFGQGRLPCASMQASNDNGRPAVSALQPGCLILVTDGACLRHSPDAGGGTLQVQLGSQPLRELYNEPFRWDQRVFCLAVGDAVDSKQCLHPQLRTLVDITGGAHWMVRQPSNLPTDALMKRIRPPFPRQLPIRDPLYARLPAIPYLPGQANAGTAVLAMPPGGSFVNGGPICCFQAFEGDEGSRSLPGRAMLLYVASLATTSVAQGPQPGDEPQTILSPPLWCIPESYFPNKKTDVLPPRPAQPLLFYSKYPSNLGSKSFEPMQVIQYLHKLDQLVLANRRAQHLPAKCLHRDIYVCEWLSPEGDKPTQAKSDTLTEYYPVFCRGAGRPTLSDDSENVLNVGILYTPQENSNATLQGNTAQQASLTMLPPEPHILLPLLIRAAEAEQRAIKKSEFSQTGSNKLNVILDDHWRSEFQAYLFRLPPYYQPSLRRCLRPILPACVHTLLHSESSESVALQCLSKASLQRIRNGEQIARDTSERLELQEAILRRVDLQRDAQSEQTRAITYGNYDPRIGVESYLETLRSLPAPWRGHGKRFKEVSMTPSKDESGLALNKNNVVSTSSVLSVLGDLPATCLMAYYESRRRWIFGGPPLSTQGLHVEGVDNGGSNVQRCGSKFTENDDCLLSIAGVGVSTLNETTTSRMGDYKDRLIYSRSPIVGYGSNHATGVAATTSANGSPTWSVDDSAMPQTFFDGNGEFVDNFQARSLSKILVNFGNPFREKRADSIVPVEFISQTPSVPRRESSDDTGGLPRTPPGSPPPSSFDSVEEGEAIFVTRASPSRASPKRDDMNESEALAMKRPRADEEERKNMADDESAFTEKAHEIISLSSRACKPRHPAQGELDQTPSNESKATSVKPPPPPRSIATKNVPGAPPPPRPPPRAPNGGKLPQLIPQDAVKAASQAIAGSKSDIGLLMRPQPSTDQSDADEPLRSQITAQQVDPSAIDYESPDSKPRVNIPTGWICVWSKSQKRWYFFDTKTNRSVWKWPADKYN